MLARPWVAAAFASMVLLGDLARGQVVNGGFDTGAFAPWVVSSTPQGVAVVQGIGVTDIDGPGPLAGSPAAYFVCGQTTVNSGPQGVNVLQSVTLAAGGAVYDLSLDWSSIAFIPSPGAAAVIDIIVNGVSLAQDVAPPPMPNQRSYGHLAAAYTPAAAGAYSVGFRVGRPAAAGEEITNYVDNFVLRRRCAADFNTSGGVSVQDVFDYLFAYFSGDPRADFNGAGGITVQDIFDFLAAYFAGCA